MNDLIQSLTGNEAGSSQANIMLLTMLASLLFAIGNVVLARRNDFGWWLVMLGFFANPLFAALYPGQNDYWLLLGAIPLFACAAIGMYGFSRHRLKGRFTRLIEPTGFSVVGLVASLLLALVLTILQWGQAVTTPQRLFGTLAPDMINGQYATVWLNFLFASIVAVSYLGIGFAQRWAWLLLALGGAGLAALTTLQPTLSGSERPLFGLLLGYVLIFITAVYAWFAWGSPVAVPSEDEAELEAAREAEAAGLLDAETEAAIEAKVDAEIAAEAAADAAATAAVASDASDEDGGTATTTR